MTSNVVLDAIAGSIPFVGTVIDVFYKANRRNIALLRGHMIEAHAKRKAPPQLRGLTGKGARSWRSKDGATRMPGA